MGVEVGADKVDEFMICCFLLFLSVPMGWRRDGLRDSTGLIIDE